jgi:hypothetical protein
MTVIPDSWTRFIEFLTTAAARTTLGSEIAQLKVSEAIRPGHFGLIDDGTKATIYFHSLEELRTFEALLRQAGCTWSPHG